MSRQPNPLGVDRQSLDLGFLNFPQPLGLTSSPPIELPADPSPALEFIPGEEAENLARENAHAPDKSPDHLWNDRGICRLRG
jgi:hypothetical protein